MGNQVVFVVTEAVLFGEEHFRFIAKSVKAAEKELRRLYPKLWIDKVNDCYKRDKDYPKNIFIRQEQIIE